ncbi:MAG: EamA family transporter [Pseudomonadota bacterium]
MTSRGVAYAAAVAAAVLWGGNFVAVRLALEHFDPYLLTALRFAFVAALIPIVGWPRKMPVTTLLLYSLCSGIGQYLLSTVAIQLGLSPGLAALLMQFQVFISLALSWLILGESVRTTTIAGSVLGLAGLTGVLATGGSKAPWLASAVCLLAAAGWAFANTTIKRSTESVIRLQCASGLICLPAIWLARELALPGAPPALQALVQAPLAGWLPVAYVVIASFAVAQVLWGKAIGTVGVAATSPIALLIPVFGVALAWLLLDENLSVQLLVSAAVVLAGVAVHVVPMALKPAPVPRARTA